MPLKKGKDKLTLFCDNGERVIPIYDKDIEESMNCAL